MFGLFNKKAALTPLQATVKLLQDWKLAHTVLPDGTIEVPGSMNFKGQGLLELPDLSLVRLLGDFDCSDNSLVSLKGAPMSVGGNFYCNFNELTTLRGGPKEVGGEYQCNVNQLYTLEGAPEKIVKSFICAENQLETPKGAPRYVGQDFLCQGNYLHTMRGGPEYVGNLVFAPGNRFEDYEGLPATYRKLTVDAGDFEGPAAASPPPAPAQVEVSSPAVLDAAIQVRRRPLTLRMPAQSVA